MGKKAEDRTTAGTSTFTLQKDEDEGLTEKPQFMSYQKKLKMRDKKKIWIKSMLARQQGQSALFNS